MFVGDVVVGLLVGDGADDSGLMVGPFGQLDGRRLTGCRGPSVGADD